MSDFSLALIIAIFTFIGSLAAIQFKIASNTSKIQEIPSNPSLYYGAVLYVIAAFFNILVLNYWDYTLVLPLTSITYVWTAILAKIIFKEKLGIIKILGLGLVVIGSTLIF